MQVRKSWFIWALVLAFSVVWARPLTFVLDTTPNRVDEAQAIAAQLKQIGVEVQVRTWQATVLREEILKGTRAAYMTDWGSAYFDPFDLAIPKLETGGRGNFSFYSNPNVDNLFKLASTTTQEAARLTAYRTIQQQVFRDAPWIFGYTLANLEGISANLEGYEAAADNGINLSKANLRGGDTLTVGMRTNALVTLDPAMHRDRDTEAVLRNIFDALVLRTPEGKVQPLLATSWRNETSTRFLVTLRQGVRFHNGDPFTADDVVFTFERILKEGAVGGQTSPRKGLLGPIERVEKVSDNQVRFVYSAPFPPNLILQSLVQFQIVPKRYIEQGGYANFLARPVGTGAFSFVRARLDSEIVLDRNENYFLGAPRLRRVIFRMMPEPSTRVAALLSGEVQLIQAVPPDLVSRLESSPQVKVLRGEGTRAYQIELNLKQPPFNDMRVRQALNYAINWEPILKGVYRGYAQRLSTAFLPSGFGYDPELKPYPYDPNRARTLLRQAGYDVR